MARALLLVVLILQLGMDVPAQSYRSDLFLKYNYKTHKTNKPMPFDHPFTMSIYGMPKVNVKDVYLMESEVKHGERKLKGYVAQGMARVEENEVYVYDTKVGFTTSGDSLILYMPALLPNVYFDIHISITISEACRQLLHQSMLDYMAGKPESRDKYVGFLDCSSAPEMNIRQGYLSYDDFIGFFNQDLKADFSKLTAAATYTTKPGIKVEDLQAIDIASKNIGSYAFIDSAPYMEAALHQAYDGVQTGLMKLGSTEPIGASAFMERIAGIESNVALLRKLVDRIDRVISSGQTSVALPGGQPINMLAVHAAVEEIITASLANRDAIQGGLQAINDKLDQNENMRQMFALVGNTISSDLKTTGANILFLDLGLASVQLPGLDGQLKSMQTPYWGLSIYFRPIDKSTRRESFPTKKDLNPNPTIGPDYGVVSRYSVLQHLALNVGLTWGPLPNSDFSNLYDNYSLLVGPSYRFARAFKASAGAAFARRSSANPLISEKEVVMGYYVSLSLDVDIVAGVKDFTKLFTK